MCRAIGPVSAAVDEDLVVERLTQEVLWVPVILGGCRKDRASGPETRLRANCRRLLDSSPAVTAGIECIHGSDTCFIGAVPIPYSQTNSFLSSPVDTILRYSSINVMVLTDPRCCTYSCTNSSGGCLGSHCTMFLLEHPARTHPSLGWILAQKGVPFAAHDCTHVPVSVSQSLTT